MAERLSPAELIRIFSNDVTSTTQEMAKPGFKRQFMNDGAYQQQFMQATERFLTTKKMLDALLMSDSERIEYTSALRLLYPFLANMQQCFGILSVGAAQNRS